MGYTNPRYPTRPKDIHLERLAREVYSKERGDWPHPPYLADCAASCDARDSLQACSRADPDRDRWYITAGFLTDAHENGGKNDVRLLVGEMRAFRQIHRPQRGSLVVARCRSAIDTPTIKRNTALNPATTLINGVDFLSPSTPAAATRASCEPRLPCRPPPPCQALLESCLTHSSLVRFQALLTKDLNV